MELLTLLVQDYDATVVFYTQTLGFVPSADEKLN
jgi:catechol 2,3-dioxygenase-like lactoylglutathione lyase family enzyme